MQTSPFPLLKPNNRKNEKQVFGWKRELIQNYSDNQNMNVYNLKKQNNSLEYTNHYNYTYKWDTTKVRESGRGKKRQW